MKSVETGSWLGLRHQGQGIGKEMRAAVLHFAFAGLGAPRRSSGAWDDNKPSLGVSAALGYEPNGEHFGVRQDGSGRLLDLRLPRAVWEERRRDDICIEGLDGCRAEFGITELDRQRERERGSAPAIVLGFAAAYFRRGQKKPRSPSPRRRGTTCTWRWGTLWLTRLFIATNEPSAAERRLDGRGDELDALEERPDLVDGKVGERLDMVSRHDQHVPGEHRSAVEEGERRRRRRTPPRRARRPRRWRRRARDRRSASGHAGRHRGIMAHASHRAAPASTSGTRSCSPSASAGSPPPTAPRSTSSPRSPTIRSSSSAGSCSRTMCSSKSTLTPRDRELLILRAGWNNQAPYEWGQHVAIALRSDISQEEIDRVPAGPDAPGWDPFDADAAAPRRRAAREGRTRPTRRGRRSPSGTRPNSSWTPCSRSGSTRWSRTRSTRSASSASRASSACRAAPT